MMRTSGRPSPAQTVRCMRQKRPGVTAGGGPKVSRFRRIDKRQLRVIYDREGGVSAQGFSPDRPPIPCRPIPPPVRRDGSAARAARLQPGRIEGPASILPSMPRRFDGPAMTLANMRSFGIRAIDATCDCGRRASVDVSALVETLEVPSLRWRLRCSACGSRPNEGAACANAGR